MRLRVAVLLGGRSGEHEVSVMSASSIMADIDRERFEVIPIGITDGGQWVLLKDPGVASARGRVSEEDGVSVFLPPEPRGGVLLGSGSEEIARADVFFPVLHGTFGEDGTIQGLLDLASVPYVGAGVLASAVGMDKAVMKALFQARGIPIVEYSTILSKRWVSAPGHIVEEMEHLYGYPVFVKPANLGSSVGVSKAKSRQEFKDAMELASRYDRKIIVERAVDGREVECSVLGNDEPRASLPGEILPSREFYDYHAKYIDGRSGLIIPANLSPSVTERIRHLAVEAFLAIDCSGMARVDFFILGDEVLVNEINTIPGFTAISMYPKLWEASGLPYKDLLTRLVDLAMERYREKSSLVTFYDPR